MSSSKYHWVFIFLNRFRYSCLWDSRQYKVCSDKYLWRCAVDSGEVRCPYCTETVSLSNIRRSQTGKMVMQTLIGAWGSQILWGPRGQQGRSYHFYSSFLFLQDYRWLAALVWYQVNLTQGILKTWTLSYQSWCFIYSLAWNMPRPRKTTGAKPMTCCKFESDECKIVLIETFELDEYKNSFEITCNLYCTQRTTGKLNWMNMK